MPEHPFIDYGASFYDSIYLAKAMDTDSHVPGFITECFGRVVEPLPRVTYEVLEGWNLALLGIILLLIVLNKQLYPRQLRQVLGLPQGTAHTNQLLREWSPTRSFLGASFTLAYIALVALFLQKSCIVLSRDVLQYNGLRYYGLFFAGVMGWVMLRHALLHFVNWLFDTKEVVDRQEAVQLAGATFSLVALLPIVLLLLYNPYSLFVWIGCGIIVATALTRFVLEIMESSFSTKIPWFYIFLYFCALEIAPMAIALVAGLRYFSEGTVFLVG
jgi:hypothetical protein